MTDSANILGVNHLCPKCNIEYKPHYTTKERARNSRDLVKNLMENDKRPERVDYYENKYKRELTSYEQFCSGICSDRCWKSCSQDELIQYKYLNPLTISAKHVIVGGKEVFPLTRV